ncbi:MAG: AMP-binding protein, partial [Spirochaetes bacterium]|nr:AMP-binding protein [Spirochaetota bacterium]
GDRTILYSELLQAISFFSKIYTIKKKSTAVIFAENRPEWCFSFYSLVLNKAIPVPVDFMSKADDLAYIMNDNKPEVIFYSDNTKAEMEKALKKVKHKVKKINLDSLKKDYSKEKIKEIPLPAPHDVFAILYTSGTTGSPKGVMLTWDNLLANIESVSGEVPIFIPDDVFIILLPLHHILPLVSTMIAALYLGAEMAFCPGFTGDEIMGTLQKHKVTMFIGVPRLYLMIMKGIREKINASIIKKTVFRLAGLINSKSFSKKIFHEVHEKFGGHIRYFVAGGAALDRSVGRDFTTLGFDIMEGFGLTETAPMISAPRPGQIKIGTVGLPIIRNEVKIVDGEILAKGRNVMKGYYKKKKETDEVLIDGWFHTGDLGEFDKDGYLKITGRKKEIIVLPNGKKINPNEVEMKLQSYTDKVADVAVLMKDNILQAIIKPEINKMESDEVVNIEEFFKNDLIKKYNNEVAPYKKIMKMHLTTQDIPRTRLGKVQRFKLEELIDDKNKKFEKATDPLSNEYRILKKYLEKETGKKIFADDHLEVDLGLDSLDKISLLVFIKSEFGIEMAESDFSSASTPRLICSFINDYEGKKISPKKTNWSALLKNIADVKLPRSRFPHLAVKNILQFVIYLYSGFRIKAAGEENIPASPYIISANHQSHLDALLIYAVLKNRILRKTYVFAKEKHFKSWWRKFYANRGNVIIMDVQKDIFDSIQKMAQVLKSGSNLIIFPEGTRSNDGIPGNFKKTFAILSREMNVPIVPVAIDGSYKAWKAGSRFIKPFRHIDVKFLVPVYPDKKMSYDEISDKVRSRIVENLTLPKK